MAKAKRITGIDSQAATGKNARIIALVRLGELYDWEKYVYNPQNVQELHNLRIAAKRLRYTLEVFESVLPESAAGIIGEVTQIQEELGTLHDTDVMIGLLRLCLEPRAYGDTKTAAHQQTLSTVKRQEIEHLVGNAALIASLVDPDATPSPEELRALKHILHASQQQREAQYATFRQHWDRLQDRDFKGEVQAVLTEVYQQS